MQPDLHHWRELLQQPFLQKRKTRGSFNSKTKNEGVFQLKVGVFELEIRSELTSSVFRNDFSAKIAKFCVDWEKIGDLRIYDDSVNFLANLGRFRHSQISIFFFDHRCLWCDKTIFHISPKKFYEKCWIFITCFQQIVRTIFFSIFSFWKDSII